MLVLPRAEAKFLHPQALVDAAPQSERVARILKAIVKVWEALSTVQSLQHMERRLLESILEPIPAGRAALLHLGSGSADVVSARHWQRESGETPAVSRPARGNSASRSEPIGRLCQ